ncbi:MHC class II transactivator isoform X1 [Pitangus sulphuratus]|nr:MHC class II transactivator isoform X1 [Pitangus sulphuratus]
MSKLFLAVAVTSEAGKRQTMDFVPESGYLDLLHSDFDPLQLCAFLDPKSSGDGEGDFTADLEVDASSYEQLNNMDFMTTMENGENGDGSYLCTNTTDAYAKMAELVEYVLKDHQEKQVEDIFAGNLNLDEMAAENTEKFPDVKKQKCHKRTFLGSAENCTDASEPKYRKIGSSEPLTAGFLPVSVKGSQDNPGFADPPQQLLNFVLENGISDFIIYPDVETFEEVQDSIVPSEDPFKTRELVETFCTSLKDYFRDMCKFVTMEREVALDHLFIDGTLVQSQTETRTGRNNAKTTENQLVTCSLHEKEKTAIDRSQIFQIPQRKGLETKVIVVLGKAGMGKSILVQKICQDWSNGEFSEFEFVFWFDCEQISLPEKRYSLNELLLEFFVKPQEGSKEIFEYILQNPAKVLLVFDSFKGLYDHENSPRRSASLPEKDLYSIKELLSGLIQKKILNGCTLLFTARPKDKVYHCVSKVDKTIEIVGFSPEQRELYITKYFEGLPHCDSALKLVKEREYLFSHCYSPGMCRFICFLCETALEMGEESLPSTLSEVFLKFFQQKTIPVQTDVTGTQNQENLAALARIAWCLGEKHQSAMKSDLFPSKEVKEFALKYGFFLPFAFPRHSDSEEEEFGSTFSDFVVQNFLCALHLLLAEELKDKSVTKYLSFPSKRKKPYNWLDLVPRFLSGLLFLQDDPYFCSLSNQDAIQPVKKQNKLLKYIRRLQINDLCPERLLELLRCVYETQNHYLLQHVALRLKPDLSFLDIVLTPPDVHVLHSILKRSRKEFSLDLRNSSIDMKGLKDLVSLKNVMSFRASLNDTVRLWKSLEQSKDYELLKASAEKFVLNPFKAKTMKDISDLSDLVEIQEKMVNCEQDASDSTSYEIRAIKNLRKLEFALDALSENGIGDEGAKSLSEVFPTLTSLETLNLYNNNISDFGAENLAKVLPAMTSLRVLEMWNPTIPHGILEYLQQLDSRISV